LFITVYAVTGVVVYLIGSDLRYKNIITLVIGMAINPPAAVVMNGVVINQYAESTTRICIAINTICSVVYFVAGNIGRDSPTNTQTIDTRPGIIYGIVANIKNGFRGITESCCCKYSISLVPMDRVAGNIQIAHDGVCQINIHPPAAVVCDLGMINI